ncbi:hypothetical protein V5799_008836 [Amblyomma americanum]|uniref:Uncharacterized protein n=1 Tax=Amblyomma americanum TaxID=6943 RepID=A0AAQ4FCA6_AMBAM
MGEAKSPARFGFPPRNVRLCHFLSSKTKQNNDSSSTTPSKDMDKVSDPSGPGVTSQLLSGFKNTFLRCTYGVFGAPQ